MFWGPGNVGRRAGRECYKDTQESRTNRILAQGHMETSLETQQLVVPTSGLLALETPTGMCPLVLPHGFCCFLPSTARRTISLDELDIDGPAITPS